MQVFGMKYMLEFAGVIGISSGILSLILGLISCIFGLIWKTGQELILPYRVMFFIGILFCLAAIYLERFDSDEQFEYENNKKINLNDVNNLNNEEFNSGNRGKIGERNKMIEMVKM